MSIFSLIRRAPKRLTAALLMIAAAIIIPAAVLAWGPDTRELFTTAHPADHVTFNSITDNPVQGFEPNFVQVKEATASNSTYAETAALSVGKEYTVFMYYHNNASSTFNDAAHNYSGIAVGAYAKTAIPAVVAKGGAPTKAYGYIGATNATPGEVFDDITFTNSTSADIALRYVAGSAHIYNAGAINGMQLPDSLASTGTPIGFDHLDGKVPGCNEFAGYITFKVKADQPNFTLSKQVRLAGTTEWKESVQATAGATVEYQIRYANTGTTEQKNVGLKDTLPTNMSYVAGSSYLKNTSFPNGKLLNDDLTTKGINIGDYLPGGAAYVKFSAKVAAESALPCGTTTLHNVARVETTNGSKEDGANVVVNKECQPGKISVCELSTKKIITIDESDFNAKKHSKDLSDCVELPHTGTTENIVAIVGLGALIASIVYYAASRKALNQ